MPNVTKKRRNARGKPGSLLRMRDLTKATALRKSTILHYVNEGLLPSPVKTGPNMAYYDPACVERIGFIRLMQSKHRMSLASIRALLQEHDQGRDLSALAELHETIFGDEEQPGLDMAAFCRATGLTEEQVKELTRVHLLLPLRPGIFDRQDAAVGRILKVARELGMTAQDGAFYYRLAERIVDHEMALRKRITEHLPFDQDAAVTMDMTRAARALRMYVIDRVFQLRVLSLKGLKDKSHGK
ncbi:MAG: MerR family transcriptional regulator [Deltaproteobacteria bacterium]|nr:MerR family transcriptional regulator [Deltaproteobacteria bacterium]